MISRLESFVSRNIFSDIEARFRYRLVLYLLIVRLSVHIVGVTGAVLIHHVGLLALSISLTTLVGDLIALVCLILLKKPYLAFFIMIGSLFLEMAGIGYANGGVFAPVVSLIVVVPALSVSFLGNRQGRWALWISLGFLFALAMASKLGWVLPPALDAAQASKLRTLTYTLDAVLLFVMARAQNIANEQMRSASVELARISDLGTLADGISHEINNPMTVIVNSVGILRKRLEAGDLSPELKTLAFDNIQIAVTRIVEITNALNTLAKSGSKMPTEVTKVSSLVRDALVLCEERFTAAGIRLEVETFDESLTVACRPSEITSVLLSLLSNSFDAVRDQKEKQVSVAVKSSPEGVDISVSDSGAPIHPEKRKKLFSAFWTTKDPGKGTGLSLYLGRNILSQHQGRLFLEENAKNTTFVIFIPKVSSTTPASA